MRLVLAGMVAGVSYQIESARERVAEEVSSTAILTYQLIDSFLPDNSPDLDYEALLARLSQLDNARHLIITIVAAGESSEAMQININSIEAPVWFVRRVNPQTLEFRKTLSDDNEILIMTNPGDEIREVWEESKNFILALLALLLIFNSVLYFIIGRWFKPVRKIVSRMEDVEKGTYSEVTEKASLPELNVISEKLNHLARVLDQSKLENDRLSQQALAIREEERRYLAHELHDELGQSISAIKAIAFSIAQRAEELDAMSAEGAKQIDQISDDMKKHIRNMMSQLHPTMLDELGLVPAVEQMVDDWNIHHSDCFCSLTISGNVAIYNPAFNINIYRIIQESLNNVANHASAEQVDIILTGQGNLFSLLIKDNGCGFDLDHIQPGMGLSGIKERVLACNGKFEIASSPSAGTMLSISIDAEQFLL